MNSQITLQEGIDEFNRKNMKYLSERDVSDEAKDFFSRHDIAHVVFGCDTSVFGEGIVKIWTVFGTTLGFWKHIKGYNEANAFSLFRMYSWRHVAKNISQVLFAIPTIIIRAKRMSKLWNWTNHESYLKMPIGEIRKEFNIEIMK